MSFWDTDPIILGLIAALIALVIADNQTKEQNNVFGNFIVGIGCIILIVASQQEAIDARQEQNNNDVIKELKAKIEEISKKIK